MSRTWSALSLVLALAAAGNRQRMPAATFTTNSYFKIQVLDEQTGRGVPLVEFKTVNSASWWTDSNGIIAFDEPGLTGQEVYFHIRGHGYEYPKDLFGNRGVKLKPARGGAATIKVKRLNIAERLYRITGQGIYRDSVLAGHPVPLRQPILNGQVMGQDTVLAAPYRGKLYWFWGDTERVSYPLGNFSASGATSELPGRGGLDPSVGVDLTYYVDASGFSKGMCPDFGPGLQWIESVMTVPDESGKERLVARVSSQKGLMPAYAWHLAIFNDEKEIFESKVRWDIADGHDSAHPFRARVDGVEYYYLYPNWRVRADLKSLSELQKYEALTCVAGDGKVRGPETSLERDAAGRPRYSWKAGADRLHPGRVRELISAGTLKPEESWIDLRNLETGARIQAGRGSVYWNKFRRRWVMLISVQAGEIWFTEGDTPAGPWVYARRVVSHDNYNFYNPTQHPFFDQDGGRLIYFEGTYTAAFSGAREQTPRYDYNQIMYRLALDDPRLTLPAPVYRVTSTEGQTRYLMREGLDEEKAWDRVKEIAFFAVPPMRLRAGLASFSSRTENGNLVLKADASPGAKSGLRPLFFALPATNAVPAETVDGVWQCKARTSEGGKFFFALELSQHGTGIEIVSNEADKSGKGTFRQRRIELKMTIGGKSYLLTAELSDGTLTGEWKQTEGDERGVWSAAWDDFAPSEDRSAAVTMLYEYIRDDGQRIYSTDPELAERNLKRAAIPLCRVWRNPMALLIHDAKAQPVLLGER